MKKLLASLLLTAAATTVSTSAQSLVINEVMQSNIDYLMADNDFPDSWVELYNPTSASINVSGWSIGTKDDASLCYRLPSATVPAGGHLVVYCDKEANGLHTDFRVDSGKGSIYLFDAQGTQADVLTLKKMPAPNVAYGRTSDGADDWHYEFTPTAGSANAGGGSQAVLPQPEFSIPGGAYTSPIDMVYITMPEGVPDDATICYTFDGTEPTLYKGRGKMLYFPISRTTIIRAKIMSETGNGVPSRSVTHSYIFHPREVTMPVVSLVTDNKYMNDPQIGILSSTVNDGVPNYMRKWRRPLNIEYFNADGTQLFTQLGETAVSGVSTREQPQKSLKLYANKRFGTKTFNGSFWKDKPEVTAVKSMVLRSGGNNSMSSRINDALVQTLFGTHVDNLDWQAYQPVIVYLNGKYIGEFGLRERSDEDYVEANYDGLEDVELADETSYQTPVSGTLFQEFYNAYHSSSTTYDDMCELMDMDNFLKSLAAEIYGMNTDYPTNNVSMWRALPLADGDKADAMREAHQQWRWILKDMDRFGMSLPLFPRTFDMIRYMFNPDYLMYGGMHHFDIYERMGKYSEFRELFIKTMAVYLGDFLKPSVVNGLMERMKGEVAEEARATLKLFNVSYNDFNSGITDLERAINSRPENLYKQMADYFNLGSVLKMSVAAGDASVSINGIRLTEGDFDGCYYPTLPLSLSSGSTDFTWMLTVRHSDGSETTEKFDSSDISLTLSKYMASTKDNITVSWSLIPNEATAISQRLSPNTQHNTAYNVLGQRVNTSVRGIRIVNGKKVVNN